MSRFILTEVDFEDFRGELGAKTLQLYVLKQLGLRVPPFIAVPSSRISTLWSGSSAVAEAINALEIEIEASLPAEKYAIRSSALVEDGKQTSFAGYFHSEIDVAKPDLGAALRAVLEHAAEFLLAHPQGLSLLIQEYVDAEFSGICFTRDPLGQRNMIIEHAPGPCAPIVSGMLTPKRIERCHGGPLADARFTPVWNAAERLEQHYAWPQDIEWCFSKGEYFFLQTRPITTLSAAEFAGMQLLDIELRSEQRYLYEKTGVTEVAPNPCPSTLSLLQLIYAEDGPVNRVYKRYGVRYEKQAFLRIFGRELYIDRSKERHTLFPAYALNAQAGFSLRLQGLKRTLQNMLAFRRAAKNQNTDLQQRLKLALESELPTSMDIPEILKSFSEAYTLIFEVNLMAELAVSKLRRSLGVRTGRIETLMSQLLSGGPANESLLDFNADGLIGNSLDLMDEQAFLRSVPAPDGSAPSLSELPAWHRDFVLPLAKRCRDLSYFREVGRWIAVRHMHRLRIALQRIAKQHSLCDSTDIYFLSLEELAAGKFSIETAKQRRQAFEQSASLAFPDRISSASIRAPASHPLGVSAGSASGFLVSEEELESESRERRILFSPILTPSLLKHLDKVSGIVATQGGMLSHLAIVARERKLPVVVNVELKRLGLALGDQVSIDGTDGTVKALMAPEPNPD